MPDGETACDSFTNFQNRTSRLSLCCLVSLSGADRLCVTACRVDRCTAGGSCLFCNPPRLPDGTGRNSSACQLGPGIHAGHETRLFSVVRMAIRQIRILTALGEQIHGRRLSLEVSCFSSAGRGRDVASSGYLVDQVLHGSHRRHAAALALVISLAHSLHGLTSRSPPGSGEPPDDATGRASRPSRSLFALCRSERLD